MDRLRVGGQAVIEGVMMRAPTSLSVAVRRANGEISSKEDPYRSVAERFPVLKRPLIRGSIVLFESLISGFRALNYSAELAMEDEGYDKKTEKNWPIVFTFVFAIAFGLGLFVALPHLLTYWAGRHPALGFAEDSFTFHFVDGVIKLGLFMAYVKAISLMEDVRRIFQYHGAEHKAIYTYEHGEELIVENARKYPTLHPRCGTSFVLLVLVISIILFSIILPLLPFYPDVGAGLRNIWFIGIKMLLMLPVAGLAYEAIRWGADHMDWWLIKIIMGPGLWLQKMTTQPPSDDQLEVALLALRSALSAEKKNTPASSAT